MRQHPIDRSINALFRRRPALCGFTVHGGNELLVSEVTLNPGGLQGPDELCHEIFIVLHELIDECPEARELLRERTFARAFH